jgi:hypothetical protein
LQHRRSLTLAETGQQDDLSVRELKRVVMTVLLSLIDLAETGDLVTEHAGKDNAGFASYFVVKGKLGARKQANSYPRFVHRGKSARDRVVKTRRYQPVAYLRRAGCDGF